jgi:hypothetical protein
LPWSAWQCAGPLSRHEGGETYRAWKLFEESAAAAAVAMVLKMRCGVFAGTTSPWLSRNFATMCELVHTRAESVESVWPPQASDRPRWLNFGRCSMSRRGFLVTCLAVLAAGALLPPSAAADEPRFAVVSLYNHTPDVTVHFSYRWGNGNWQKFSNFRPGRAEWFSHPLDANGKAPEFDITINEAIGAAQSVNKTFKLMWHAAPDKGIQFGHKHAIRRDTHDRDYVTVENIGGPDVR